MAERLFCGGCGSQVGMDYGKTLEPDSLWLTLGLEQYCNLDHAFMLDVRPSIFLCIRSGSNSSCGISCIIWLNTVH